MTDRERQVLLFGTDAPIPERQVLTAGDLQAELEAGNLRHIRLGGIEVIRAIAYVVRDRYWGTYDPEISDLSIETTPDGFTVSYTALCRDAEQSFRYRARIEGRPDRLHFTATGEAPADFTTNRTGFVVLHPIEGVAGAPVEVEHVDGTVRQARFPELIEPYQPFMDIRALTHRPAPGLSVTCRMEGDTFEMEDQRNWTDASYKTYVRPIGLPWPFIIPGNTPLEQSVTLELRGSAAGAATSGPVVVTVGEVAGRMPALGLAYDPDRPVPPAALPALRDLGARHLRCRFDPARGHDAATMRGFRELSEAMGAAPMLEAVLPVTGPLDAAAEAIAAAARQAGIRFGTVFVSPAPDLKGTLPGSKWPDCPPLEEVYAAMRRAFPGARLGGGTYCFFTELNRKRPPASQLDVVTHLTCAIVHAADDVGVMETLDCLPAVFASARAIAGGAAYHPGPGGIGCRDNPYGVAAADNPEGARKAMALMDPRQRGLFGAAWHLGWVAQCARAGVAEATLASPVGEFGVVEPGNAYPVYHVLRGAMRAAGQPLRQTRIDRSGVQAIAWESGSGIELWLANLGDAPQPVRLEGLPGPARCAVLDAGSARAVAGAPGWMNRPDRTADPAAVLRLQPYAVWRIIT